MRSIEEKQAVSDYTEIWAVKQELCVCVCVCAHFIFFYLSPCPTKNLKKISEGYSHIEGIEMPVINLRLAPLN